MAKVVITLTDLPGDVTDVVIRFTPPHPDDSENYTPAQRLADELLHHTIRFHPLVEGDTCS
jgi:hypothetical protein